MIYGIGTDICDVRRIRASLERHGDRFAAKVLSDAEFKVWKTRSARWPERGVRFLATRFSAKEAFSKAVGLGFRGPMTLLSVEFLNHPTGQPYALPRKAMVAFMQERQWVAHVSISDEIESATAFVIIETIQPMNVQHSHDQ
jgi:holo-[acyl-carrier protein] synthase